MKYRKFTSKINFVPAALGFGLMRLPMKPDHTVDVEESVRIVRYAIDHGVNYLDTAYVYHGGESEKIMAKVLKDGYRSKVKIADKFPMWLLKEDSDRDRIFAEQLARLEVDKIDFYLLHSLGKSGHNSIAQFKMIDWIKQKKAEGKIDYIGFSFHDDFEYLKQVIELTDWDFCQLQVNFIDIEEQLNLEALQYVRQKDIGLIVMEPLRGGQLTISIPDEIMNMWQTLAASYGINDFKPAQFMLDYVWNLDEVGLVLSGMSNFEQVKQNLDYADNSKVDKLTPKQLALFDKIRKAYQNRIAINCTDCKYCKDCPQKIAIPYIFKQLNEIKKYDNQRTPNFRYGFLSEEERANKCINCGLCLSHCPQKLNIPALLKKCSEIFDEKKEFNKAWETTTI